MRYIDETQEYVNFGSRRNQVLLRNVADIAKRHKIEWVLRTELDSGFSLKLIRPREYTTYTVRPGSFGKVLERALNVLKDWTGDNYEYRRKCTFYGLEAHHYQIQWLYSPDGKTGRWVIPGAIWDDGEDMTLTPRSDAVLECPTSGELFVRPSANVVDAEGVLQVLFDDKTIKLANEATFYCHGPLPAQS